MRPAASVIVFTVLSGAGLGMFALLVLADLFGHALPRTAAVRAGLAALALTAAGLASSTFHLANPRNAWRAFSRVRTSWLSREGVAALAFLPVATAYLAAVQLDAHAAIRFATGAFAVLLAAGVLHCTGMIYACLKTVPQWNTFLTPAAYLALGAASGAVLLTLAAALAGVPVAPIAEPAVVLLAVAATLKFAYYEHARRVSGRFTLAGAVGQTAAEVRLLDAGHSHRTFLTDEFVFRLAREHGLALRILGLAAGCAAPLAIVAASRGGPGPLALAAALCLVGVAVERWLFFAEAQHVVRLYHGQRAV